MHMPLFQFVICFSNSKDSFLRSICILYLGTTIVAPPKFHVWSKSLQMMHRELAPQHLSLQQIKILPYCALWLTAKWYDKIELYNSSVMGTNVTVSMSPQKTLGSGRTSWVLGELQVLHPWPLPAAPRNPPCAGKMRTSLWRAAGESFFLFF